MATQRDHLETLTEIRSLMERSSRFISLSGLSGVSAGVCALAGVFAAYRYLGLDLTSTNYFDNIRTAGGGIPADTYRFFAADAFLVLIVSITAGMYFTMRQAKEKQQRIWDATARRLILNLFLPLAAGGFFCLVLLYHGLIELVIPSSIVFYGLALLNAGKYTFNDIRYLGIIEIAVGLIACIYVSYGLLFWAFGFGILHIVYGIVVFKKYDR